MARIISDDGLTDIYVPDEYLHDGRRRLESTVNTAINFEIIADMQRIDALNDEIKNINIDDESLMQWALDTHPKLIYKMELEEELEELSEKLNASS